MNDSSSPALTLIHTSDWHLGHELNGHVRDTEHDTFLDWLLQQILTQKADVLLVTGDIYDVANPPISAMRRLFRFLNAATSQAPDLQVIILGGNHDSAGRIDLPASLLGEGRVHFIGALPKTEGVTDFDRILLPLRNSTQDFTTWLAAIPFCRPADLGSHDLPSLYHAVTEAGLTKANGAPLILTGHLHVAGGEISELSERRITVGGEEAEAASLFDPRVAYVALGHLHRPQAITAPTTVRYAGSPFPLSATERNYKHSIALVKIDTQNCHVELLPIPRPVEFITIGPKCLDDAVSAIEAIDLDKDTPIHAWPFIEISVQIDEPEPHLQSRILAALADKPLRLVRILSVRPQGVENITAPLAGSDLAELDPITVFAAMFQHEFKGDPTEDLSRAFTELLIETQNNNEEVA